MPAHPRIAIATLALVGMAGCADEAGVELRWAILDAESENEVAPLVSVEQCSEVGIERFRLDAYALPRLPSDQPTESISFPCFPSVFGNPDAFLEGPALASGDYELELIGLRRNGLEWSCGDELSPLPCARATSELVVSASDPGRAEFMIVPPPQCDDGVDNDRDGRVDQNDLGCIFDQGYEAYDFGLVVFQLSVDFLENPLIEPAHYGVDGFVLTIDGEPFETFEFFDVGNAQLLGPWDFPPLSINVANGDGEGLAVGQHTLELTLLGSDGMTLRNADDLPIAPIVHPFTVSEDEAPFVVHTFEVVDPLRAPMHAVWAIAPTLSGEKGIDGCRSHDITLGTIEVQVTRNGASVFDELDLRVSGQPTLGGNSFACSDLVASNPVLYAKGIPDPLDPSMPTLEWTSDPYIVEITGYSAMPMFEDSECFSSGPIEVRPAPNGPMSVTLEHVLTDGKPNPGCGECDSDDDCLDAANLVCSPDRLCVERP